jgi:hypothetical protein
LLWLLNKQSIDTEIIDTLHLTKEELNTIYGSVIQLAVSKKHSIRRVFGTKHQSGIRFGVQVPALLVYEHDLESPIAIYPHEEKDKVGWYDAITINQYLLSLLRIKGVSNTERLDIGRSEDLTTRMKDMHKYLRARLGNI